MKICKKCKAVNSSKANYCKFCNSNIKNAHKISLIKSFQNLIKPKEKDEISELEQKDESQSDETKPKSLTPFKKLQLFFKKFNFKKNKDENCLIQNSSNDQTKDGFETKFKDKLLKFENSLTKPTKASFVNLASSSFTQSEDLVQNEDDLSQVDFKQEVQNQDLLKSGDVEQSRNFIDTKDDKKLLEDITIKKTKVQKVKKQKPIKLQKDEPADIKLEKTKSNFFIRFINLILFLIFAAFLIALILFLLNEFDLNLDFL